MRATFMNKLVITEQDKKSAVKYKHQFRVNVDVYIQPKKMESRDWDLFLCAENQNIPEDIRNGLIREFMVYIRHRVKRSVHTLEYTDFVDMAEAVNLS